MAIPGDVKKLSIGSTDPELVVVEVDAPLLLAAVELDELLLGGIGAEEVVAEALEEEAVVVVFGLADRLEQTKWKV